MISLFVHLACRSDEAPPEAPFVEAPTLVTPTPLGPLPPAPPPVAARTPTVPKVAARDVAPTPIAPTPIAPTPAAQPAETPGGPVEYRLVPQANALFVVVTYERGTLGSALAHDHAVVATSYSGTVQWDAADPAACRVAVDVPTSGLRVDPPGARAKAGLEGSSSVQDHPKIEANFNGEKQLDSARFPVLTFRSTGCERSGTGFDVTGPLTIHGVGRPTTVRMTIEADGTTLRAKGRFTARHGDFGMAPYSNAFGAVKNAQPLTFVLDLTAVR